MSDCSEEVLAREFRRERAVRRTLTVLATKRDRIRDELEQLIRHLSLLVPSELVERPSNQSEQNAIEEAVERLGDEEFAQLLLHVLQGGR